MTGNFCQKSGGSGVGVDGGVNSVARKVAVGNAVARVGAGRLAAGESTASVGAVREEETQAARNESRIQPFIAVFNIICF